MDTFAALGDPTRRKIFELIARDEITVGEIVRYFHFTAPTISQHLNALKQAKLVSVRADGQKRIYSVDATGFNELETWIAQQKMHWTNKLDALEQYLDSTKSLPKK